MKTSNLINEFLSVKRFAMIGVSRNPNDFSRKLYQEFLTRRYDIVPVNPRVPMIDGHRCFQKIQQITPPVSCAMLMTPKSFTDQVLFDCAEVGVTLVWIYGISGGRDMSPNALRICQDRGMKIIAGYCPYMFMPNVALFHRLHGTVWKMIGRYPT